MRRLTFAIVIIFAFLLYFAPGSRALMSGVAYTDFANIFTSNQRINAGLGVNVAPGSTGTISASGGLFERSRSTAMGEWTSVAYAVGNFAGIGGGTWTVQSGDQSTFAYTLIGETMVLDIILDSTSVSGTVTSVTIAIPGGFTATKSAWGTCYLFDNSSTTFAIAAARVSASGSTVQVFNQSQTALAASTNNTFVRVLIAFEVS